MNHSGLGLHRPFLAEFGERFVTAKCMGRDTTVTIVTYCRFKVFTVIWRASAMAFDSGVSSSLSGNLVKLAMARSKLLSAEGALERVFSFAFRRLVYPQIWEDPLVDMAAMQIEPHHHIVTIASGGCNVMSYLTSSPARITAVDLNHAHVALTKLKLAGLRGLPNWTEFYRFFGKADEQQNIVQYYERLRPLIDADTRKYWEGRDWRGRRHLDHFQTNIYSKGLLGRFIGIGHLLAKIYGSDLKELLKCRSLQQQRLFFDTQLAPLFQKRFIKWLTNRKMSLYGLGIPPAQYEALAGGGAMAQVLHERLEKLACGFPLQNNYFAWQAFGRCYAPGASGSLPPYLAETNYAKLRGARTAVTVKQISIVDALNAMPARSADRFVLLDAQDWMTDAQLNSLWRAITRAAKPGARVIFRTAGKETILPGRINEGILGQWNYLSARSLELGSLDRSSIYGGFHIYEFAN
jgi:S-adenosylmethionine-diacylglycerol 3-amino-3-carboxypropyl transferase